MSTLELKNLHVALEDGTPIVKGVDLEVDVNEVHAIMGPNGSGKSTLAYAIAGHPAYEITGGQILLDGENITEAGADERAQAGLFLAFQYPHAIAGVTVTNFLRQAVNAVRKARNGGVEDPMPVPEFRKLFLAKMDDLKVSRELASRYLNDGFSGGEKKRVEILQMAMLQPKIAVRRKFVTVTPGIACGYWNARKSPACARSSAPASVMSSPSSRICPPVIS